MSPLTPEVVSTQARAQILGDTVRDEVAGGAGIEHRDRFSAILVHGSQRVLVIVDQLGVLKVEPLTGRRPRWLAFALLAVFVVAGLLLMVVLVTPDILPD